MNTSYIEQKGELYYRLKWLMFGRVVFTSLLLGSMTILQISQSQGPQDNPLLILYGLISGIFLLSFFYTLLLNKVTYELSFAFIQISIDTLIVTLIIIVTGGFSSIFSFLYLVVIIYSSMLLYRKGSMIMAAFCSIQYGLMVDLEYYGIFKPFVIDGGIDAVNYPWTQVIYKVLITMVACFAVAFLSSLLAEQARKTKKDLLAMEEHVKRVEKMAAAGELGAGLAHEIKNPLASLTGSIQILKEEIDYDQKHDRLMKIVLREADRLSALVSNFLLFAKPPAGKIEPIELERALSEIIELFEKDENCSSRISIKKATIPNIWIGMDTEQFRQILWNLLLNSAEAIEGTRNIEIEMYLLKNRYVGIDIKDNGCGMTRETMTSMFDPFFTTKPNGTGLGLSIVHRILESYDNWLNVESDINGGTIFTMKLRRINPPT
jgi:two-component system sensor histidine kinase PilS (NtrC family)